MSITINNLVKSFDDKAVLRGFSLEIRDGETVCIMGPSGCGKTTLINILLGLVCQDEGEITGVPQKAAAVFQEPRLCEEFSLLSNVKIAAAKGTDVREIDACLEGLGLQGLAGKKVRVLSGGQKQRAAIARALLSDYDLIVMDEPFKGLDEGTRETVMDFVRKSVAGKTCIIVTHERKEAEFFSERIINMV